MANEVLRTTAELIANLPDNTSGLIQAVNSRDVVVSAVDGVGFWDDNADVGYPVTIPNAGADVTVDIMAALPAPPASSFVGNYYRVDGNNHFVPSYVDEGITVPPGTVRIVDGAIGMLISKPGGGTQDFNLVGTKAGVPYLPGRDVTLTSTPIGFVGGGSRLVDVSLAEPFSLAYTPIGAAVDLIVHEIRVDLRMVLV